LSNLRNHLSRLRAYSYHQNHCSVTQSTRPAQSGLPRPPPPPGLCRPPSCTLSRRRR